MTTICDVKGCSNEAVRRWVAIDTLNSSGDPEDNRDMTLDLDICDEHVQAIAMTVREMFEASKV